MHHIRPALEPHETRPTMSSNLKPIIAIFILMTGWMVALAGIIYLIDQIN